MLDMVTVTLWSLRPSHFIVEQFEKYLKKATDSDKPFFVYLPFHAMHKRFIAAEEYIERYKYYSREQIDYYGALSALDDDKGTAGVVQCQ